MSRPGTANLNGTRRAILGVALLFFVNGVVVGSWLPRLPEIRDRLGIDLDALGLTLALGGLGSLLGSSLSGVVVGGWGARRTAVTAGLAVYLFLPLVAVAPTAALLALVLAVMGFLDANADVGMNAVGVRVEEAHGRSVMTRLHGLWSLGTLIGSGVSALAVLVGVDFVTQLSIISVLGIGTALFAMRLIPDAPPRARQGARSGRLAIGLMLAGGFAVFVEGAPFDWSALYLVDVTGSGQALAGTGVIVFTAGMLIGRLAGDHIVDRFGAVPTLYSGVVVSVIAMFFVVVLQTVPAALAGFLIWGLGISAALPVLYKLAGSHRSFGEGSGLAALTVGTRLGFMAAPALIGVAATAWSLPIAIAIVVSLAATASLVAVRLTIAPPVTAGDSLPGGGNS
ncbi:MAG TPA: MFS transporter [Acidimicrobiia bacterium]|nr:MFS transporter [Acidimicrobiia bacterium]